jgi:hypothetical protein
MMLVSSHRTTIRSFPQQEEPLFPREPVELQAEARFQQSPHVSRCRISCMFHEGVLVLRGPVPSYYAKQIAQTVIRSLGGVLRIDNQLDVTPTSNSEPGT